MRVCVLCWAFAGAMFVGSPALAQGKGTEAASPQAEKLQIAADQAAAHDDWRKAGELSSEAYRRSPSLVNEFNLASYYARSGQYALAVPLYADVAANGQFSEGFAVYDYRHDPRPKREGFNFSDEANRRLAELSGATPPMASNSR